MEASHYVIRGGVDGRERLRVLARVMLPATRALLTSAGVGDGMSCLDVGCGGGDVTREIARLVGPSGRVLGIDLDRTKIELAREETRQAALSWAEFRVSEIGADAGADAPGFDRVYARFVLTHLADPAAAVAWMLRQLRPGGLVVVEDIDCRGHFCHPESAAFGRYVELYTQVVKANGADPNIGPSLPGLLLDAGCVEVRMNVVQPAGFEGEVKLLAPLTMANVADAILAAGLASHEEVDQLTHEMYALAADPRSVLSLPRIVQAWGVRPA